MDSEISLTDDLLSLPWMATVLTDTHFFQRDRMGRIMVFLARATKSGWGGAALAKPYGGHAYAYCLCHYP